MVEKSASVNLSEPIGIRTMKAAELMAPGLVEIVEVPIPEPTEKQVRIRLEGCGVCASNIPPFQGREWFSYPMSPGGLGHEGWGVVDAVGAEMDPNLIGRPVAALSQNAYAQYDLADEDSFVLLPESLKGRPFPGEPLGCAVNIHKRSQIRPGDTVVIVGIGFLGALLIQLAKRSGATIIAVARRPFAQDIAARMGADHILPMEDHWQIIEQVKALTGGRFADVVVECVGKQWPLDLAAELTKERGRLVIAGYHQDGPRQVNMQLWNWRGLDVINAHEREHQIYIDGMREAIQLVENGTLNPDPLYTHRMPLCDLGEALTMANDRPDGFMKALIIYE